MKNSHQTRPIFQTVLCPFVIFVLFVVKKWPLTKPATLVNMSSAERAGPRLRKRETIDSASMAQTTDFSRSFLGGPILKMKGINGKPKTRFNSLRRKKENTMQNIKTFNTQTEGSHGEVRTKQEQDDLTPDQVLDDLKAGNARFVAGEIRMRNHTAQVGRAVGGQYPEAIVLSCVDSRVPVENVLDQGIGDLFVARVAGNFVNTDILGSMEFACKVSGSKLVVVMGHQHCGAVKGAIDDVELGHITSMLGKIKPAVEQFADYSDEKSSKNAEFVQMVAEKNVELNVENVRQQSPILREMEANGEIKIVGAMYDLSSGKVNFMDA